NANTTASENTAIGLLALQNNTTGGNNTATGSRTLFSNTTGNNNIALGYGAGSYLTTGDNNIDIGNFGLADESNTIRIGDVQTATYIAGIRGTTVSGSLTVVIDANGQLGTVDGVGDLGNGSAGVGSGALFSNTTG